MCCISGCLFAIRRELLLEIEPAIRARHWFGIPVNQGEARFLTHQTLLRGYGTYINNDALCWTTVPNTLSVLFKQQLRWRRSIVRDLFYTLRSAATRLETAPKHGVYAGTHTARSAGGFSGRGNHALSGPFGLGRTSAASHRAWNRESCVFRRPHVH